MFLDVPSPRWFRIHNISQILQYQPNITISSKYHNISQISQFQPNITISAKYHNSDQFHNFRQSSQVQPKTTISAKYFNISRISQYQPTITISAKYHNISQISQYQPNITILAKYHNISQISQFWPNFTISAKFHSLCQISQDQSCIVYETSFMNFGKKLQYDFLKMMGGGGWSKAVWNFSENSSVSELLGFPYPLNNHSRARETLFYIFDMFVCYKKKWDMVHCHMIVSVISIH